MVADSTHPRCVERAAGAQLPELQIGKLGPTEGDELLARDRRSWGKPPLEGHRNKE
jgi:hypothetical protein